MNIETTQADEGNDLQTEAMPVDPIAGSESVITSSTPRTEEEAWQVLQSQTAAFFANIPKYTAAFFRNNRQVLTALGWILLAVLGIRVLLAAVDAIDDLPLVTFVLKLIGLVYVVQFARRYLMRASDREELAGKINQVKSDLIGS